MGVASALGWTLLAAVATRIAFSLLSRAWALWHQVPLHRAAESLGEAPLAIGVAQLLGLGSVTWGLLSPPHRNRPLRALGFRPVPVSWLLLALLGGMGLQLPLAELGTIGRLLWPESAESLLGLQRSLSDRSWPHLLALALSLGLLAPFLEEALFRGALQERLRRRYGAATALATTACLFGASHLLPPMVLYASAAGLLLGLLRLRCGSTWVPVAAHLGVNSLPLLLPASVVAIDGFNVPDPTPRHVPLGWLSASGLLAAAAFGTLWRISGRPGTPPTVEDRSP